MKQEKDRSDIEEIKRRVNIVDIVSGYIKLDRVGNSYKARCPFHNERTPSFYVSSDRGSYYCFGCGAKGDIFSFVEHFEGTDFKGSLSMLADKAGVKLHRGQKEDTSETDDLYDIMESACLYFENNIRTNTDALAYLKKRGLRPKTISDFRIGVALDDWRTLHDHLIGKKYPVSLMLKAGLVKESNGKVFDRFRNRIIFPIIDQSGRVIAFTGRTLAPQDPKTPKYLNSPETLLYDKSEILFGIDKAKTEIRKRDYCILVEGQMDLIMSHQAGLRNTVAVSGTALNERIAEESGKTNNLGLIRRLTKNIILALDSDKAGRNATLRSAHIALSLGMEVKVARWDEGNITNAKQKDPADLILENPGAWEKALKQALPLIDFALAHVYSEGDPGRRLPQSIREHVLPFVVRMDSPLSRAHAVKQIHDKTGIAEKALFEEVANLEIEHKKTGEREVVAKIDPDRQNKKTRILERIFGYLWSSLPNNASLEAELVRIFGADIQSITNTFLSRQDELVLSIERSPASDIDKDIEELLINLEEEVLKELFEENNHSLRIAERDKDTALTKALIQRSREITKRLQQLTHKHSA